MHVDIIQKYAHQQQNLTQENLSAVSEPGDMKAKSGRPNLWAAQMSVQNTTLLPNISGNISSYCRSSPCSDVTRSSFTG